MSTADYLHWLDAQIEVVAADLREQAGPGLADAAERMTDLMVAKTVLREFIAHQAIQPNKGNTLNKN